MTEMTAMTDPAPTQGWSREHYGFEDVRPAPSAAVAPRRTPRRMLQAAGLAVALVAGSGAFAASFAVAHDGPAPRPPTAQVRHHHAR